MHNIQKRLLQSRFFTISLFLHVILVVVMSGTVLFNKYVEPPDFTGGEGGSFVVGEPLAQTPPEQQLIQQPTFQVTNVSAAAPIQTITTAAPTSTAFTVPQLIVPTTTPGLDNLVKAMATPPPTGPEGLTKEIAVGIKNFTGGWAKGGEGGPGSSVRTREFEFTAYLAKYAGGNWASTVRLTRDNKQIEFGSLPNLLYIIQRLSKDKIKATPQAIPLDLASDEIFAKKPPFIFFTGHRDFKLNDAEVANLRKYITLGGCIWGDSSVPGLRSRFDIAFRREMKRVVPDVNKEFEPLPPDHPIYTRGYWQEIKEVPTGMNFYKEPVFALRQFGEIGILYTPNDYGDMWQFGLTDKWEFDLRRNERGDLVGVNWGMWIRRGLYFRNINEASVKRSYMFGMNAIVHLLTRWEDKVRNVPKSL